MKFPRLVYKSAAEYMLVQNEDEHAEAIEIGWFSSVPESMEKHSKAEEIPVEIIVHAKEEKEPLIEVQVDRKRGRPAKSKVTD